MSDSASDAAEKRRTNDMPKSPDDRPEEAPAFCGVAWIAIVRGLPTQIFQLEPGDFVVGRSPETQIPLNHVEVSRRHCRFSCTPGEGWIVEDLGSQWGTLFDGKRITSKTLLRNGSRISLGPIILLFGLGELPDEARFAELKQAAVSQAEYSAVLFHGRPAWQIQLADHLAIGRDPGGDVVLNDPAISRRHAIVKRTAGGFKLTDLRSTAGSFVNGHRFDEHELTVGDRIQFGPFFFEFDGENLNRVQRSGGGEIRAEAVTVRAGALTILEQISLQIASCEFAGIIGPSGAGKSTLLDTLSGMRSPSKGSVLVNGADVYTSSSPGEFGYVPQEDIVHPELSVMQALDFSAKLRLSRHTPKNEIRKLVAQTMLRLGLSEQGSTKITQLSGGQRKRVSVGVELLARPPVLFLDEPSSGLDPATEFKLMELLRDLADTGCTIICATHVMENVYLMDRIVVLCRGKLIFDGSPEKTREHFGVSRLSGLYDRLDERTPKEWSDEFKALREEDLHAKGTPRREYAPKNHGVERRGAWAILMRRQWTILRSDWRNFAILLGQPIIIALLVSWVSDDASLALFFAYIAALWFGCSNGAQEIVREIPIYRRERIIGVGRNAYLLSKIAFLGSITLIQAFLLYVTLQLGELGLNGNAGWQMASLAGTSIAASGIGLAISSLARSVMQAVMVVPLLLIPMILLSGYTVPAHDMEKPVVTASTITPAFAAQRLMDTSFLWKQQIARRTLADHWVSFRNLNLKEDLRTGEVYERSGPGLGALLTLAGWSIITYGIAYTALRTRETKRSAA
jgi:ABC-type multidrug transport system ATPase subunit